MIRTFIFSIGLIGIILSSQFAHAENAVLAFEADYARLVRETQSSSFTYRLTPAQFAHAFSETEQRQALQALNEQINKVSGRGFSNYEAYEMQIQKEEFLANRVNPLVNRLLKMNKAQINLLILQLARDYLLNDQKRIAAQLLLEGIAAKKFSQEELNRLAKEDTYGHQAVEGSKWGTGVAVLGGLVVGARRNGPSILSRLKGLWTKAPQKVSAAKNKIKEVRGLTLQEALEIARQGGVRFASDLGTNITEVLTRKNKLARIKEWSKNFHKSETFSDIAFVVLANGAGAATFTGYHALHKAFFKENMKNGMINPQLIRDEYYDGLAVLKLSCQVQSLVPRAESLAALQNMNRATQAQLEAEYKKLLIYYADFMYLKDATGRFDRPTALSPHVRVVGENVVFRAPIRGQVQELKFACPALKGLKTHPIEVSLGEVLDQLTQAFTSLEGAFFKLQE